MVLGPTLEPDTAQAAAGQPGQALPAEAAAAGGSVMVAGSTWAQVAPAAGGTGAVPAEASSPTAAAPAAAAPAVCAAAGPSGTAPSAVAPSLCRAASCSEQVNKEVPQKARETKNYKA